MTAEVITTFETRRRLRELAGVKARFQAIADAGGPLADIAQRWVELLTVVDQQAANAIKLLEDAERA